MERQREVLVDALFSQGAEKDGVPRYSPGVEASRWPILIKSPNHEDGDKLRAKAYWELETAFLRDLEGRSSGDIADALGLTDHVGWQKFPEGGRSRSADRYVTAGRKLFGALGAWPWTHAEDGRLPPDWTESEVFRGPFFDWHRGAFVDAQLALEAARTGNLGFPKSADLEAARRLYEHGLAGSPH